MKSAQASSALPARSPRGASPSPGPPHPPNDRDQVLVPDAGDKKNPNRGGLMLWAAPTSPPPAWSLATDPAPLLPPHIQVAVPRCPAPELCSEACAGQASAPLLVPHPVPTQPHWFFSCYPLLSTALTSSSSKPGTPQALPCHPVSLFPIPIPVPSPGGHSSATGTFPAALLAHSLSAAFSAGSPCRNAQHTPPPPSPGSCPPS